MEATVLGGAVLGCGGGGKLEDGLNLGEWVSSQGGACLLSRSNLSTQETAAVVILVHTSGSHTQQIHPTQIHQAVDMLQNESNLAISGVVNGGQGGVESLIGWELSGYLDVPLLDAGIPPRYHPSALRNLLEFWQETAMTETFIISLAGGLEQGRGQKEMIWRGRPFELLQRLENLSSAEGESYVAAAVVLPKTIFESKNFYSPISHALQVGQTMLSVNDHGGEEIIAALQTIMPCQFFTYATVRDIEWHGQGQDRYGDILMLDVENRHLHLNYCQRYRKLTVDGRRRAVFPDLVVTLGILGTPLTGEEVFIGQDLYLMVVA
jgi:DUF917 family protein